MDAALWATVVVALAGHIAGFLTVRYTGARAYRQLLAQKDIERDDERDKVRREDCRTFLMAARQIQNVGSAADDKIATTALHEVRRAAAGLELYAPTLAPDVIHTAVRALEQLVRRRDVGWSDLRTEAEAECEQAVSALREAMQVLLNVQSGKLTDVR